MVNHTALDRQWSSNVTLADESLAMTSQNNSACLIKQIHANHLDGPYVWSKSMQGFGLASYFYGYIITQIPGGWLAGKYGGRNILGVTNIIASGLTMLIPFFSQYGYLALSGCRFFIGLAHGVFWPAMSSIFVSWAPSGELMSELDYFLIRWS
jgi:MFS family permease